MNQEISPSRTAVEALVTATRADTAIQQHITECIEAHKAVQTALRDLGKLMWSGLFGVAGVMGLVLIQLITDGRILSIFK